MARMDLIMTGTAKEIAELTRDEWPAEVRDLPTDKMRAFTLYYCSHRNGARASKEAGYLPETADALDHAQNAYKLLHREDVTSAVIAMTRRQLRALAPEAINALKELLQQPFGKDRARAIAMVLERTDAPVTKHSVTGEITHKHVIDHEEEALNQLRSLKALGVAREKLAEVFGQFGLERLEAKLEPEPIDAEFSEVTPERDPDADLLGE